ncbi:tetratricopeptide repeat protein [Polaribacter sp. MSW13]|uniref:Adenylate cyclase n=1 Tax=Polaribacter marinus TaxID=2916838 RepID=A0A9X2AP13_9FLAO|nr:adenylate/guanylate cyclase domain-containing protein [Polaribacter marinus]MCI2230519.1 tetratricopeptide repeat protein [Polaribacter marinus]
MGFFTLCTFQSFSQDQSLSDSLKIKFKKNNYQRAQKLKILEDIAFSETNTDEILIYSKELIESAKEMDSAKYIYSGYLQMGNAYRLNGDLTEALDHYFKASKVALDKNLNSEYASIKIAIADAYSIMEDSKNAVSYYRSSIKLLKEINPLDTINLASAHLNLGDEYYNQQKLDSALYYFKESERLFKAAKSEVGEAYNLGNVGLVYAEKDENIKAEKNLNEAIRVLTEIEDFYPICVYLNAMSDIYAAKKQNKKALEYSQKSLDLAEKYGFKDQISDGFLKLSTIYEKRGQYKNSLNLYKKHVIYRDSVSNVDKVKAMADLETKSKLAIADEKAKLELTKQQAKTEILNEQNKTQKIIVIAIGIALLLIGFISVSLFKNNKIIAKEKTRSDNLLKNILPDETAKELKENGSVRAKRFESVSVLFTDFKGFTQFSENLTPEELVKSIDFYFSKFDEIIEKHGLEKIKTVGDAYMCASGLPFPSQDHAYKITLAALDIVNFVNRTMLNAANDKPKLAIRVGINSGSVVAGVVGTKKFAYDIWGDAVNVASRMESSGAVGRVNISESTFNILKDNKEFFFESRGAIEAKGKGKINMYFVDHL